MLCSGLKWKWYFQQFSAFLYISWCKLQGHNRTYYITRSLNGIVCTLIMLSGFDQVAKHVIIVLAFLLIDPNLLKYFYCLKMAIVVGNYQSHNNHMIVNYGLRLLKSTCKINYQQLSPKWYYFIIINSVWCVCIAWAIHS